MEYLQVYMQTYHINTIFLLLLLHNKSSYPAISYIFFLCSIFLWNSNFSEISHDLCYRNCILPEGCNRDIDVTDARMNFFSVTEHWQKILIVTTLKNWSTDVLMQLFSCPAFSIWEKVLMETREILLKFLFKVCWD